MTPIAPHIAAFLNERLPLERRASENTRVSYAYAFQLLFVFASKRLRIAPCELQLEHIDAPLVIDFLNDLETSRGNAPSSRNIRLAAIKSFMRYLQYRVPSALEHIQRVLAIPAKKTDMPLVHYLTPEEMQSILDAPDPTTYAGVRDRAMLHLAYAAGLRVSELVGLQLMDVQLGPRSAVTVHGKGRRERALPLWKQTAQALRAWIAVRRQARAPELFLNARGEAMTRSGFEYILRHHVRFAAKQTPSLLSKHISPHVLRHSCAMTVLGATHDIRKVSLWLGHVSIQTTEMYLRADEAEKFETLKTVPPPTLRTGRFEAPDKLLALLKSSVLCAAEKP